MSLFSFLREYKIRPQVQRLLESFKWGDWVINPRNSCQYHRSYRGCEYPIIDFDGRFIVRDFVCVHIDRTEYLILNKRETKKFIKIKNARLSKIKAEREKDLLLKLTWRLNK